MSSRRKGRVLAVQALYSWDLSYALTGKTAIPEGLLDFAWLEEDKVPDEGTLAFSRLLVAGAVENIAVIDGLIKGRLKNWDMSRLNRVDLAVLRMSVYALLYQSDVAPSIVINEAIGISQEFGTDESYRFVNDVLDSIRRDLAGEGAGPGAPGSGGGGEPAPAG